MAAKTIKLKSQRPPLEMPPTALTIFGATGDLAANFLLPSLRRLDAQGLMPDNFRLVCVGRRDFTTKQYLDFIAKKMRKIKSPASRGPEAHFFKHIVYYQGSFDDPASFKGLAKLLADRERPSHLCFNRLYYFATAPQYFAVIARILQTAGLLTGCSDHQRTIRVLVEKPFGSDLDSARALNRALLKYFEEKQIYRIDHYLGKETVQNLMVARFANSLFEPLWNRRYIDHVEISVLEKDGVGSRGPYYNGTGALRDMVQNHVLQMLALLAMEEPNELSVKAVRDNKVKVLKALRPFTAADVRANLVCGQYRGYQKEIRAASQTETFAALKVFVNNARWQGVPFYLRTGKNLFQKLTEISVHFKQPRIPLFEENVPNILIFRIQPDESVHLQVNNKIPGYGVDLHRGNLEFSYSRAFAGALPAAYERLMLDFVQGDQRLFIRSDEIEAAWKFMDSVRKNRNRKNSPLRFYKGGSRGPKQADDLIRRDGREWQAGE